VARPHICEVSRWCIIKLIPSVGYRNISLNLEVGWVSNLGVIEMLPVREWEFQRAQRHICEVQLLLRSQYDAMGASGHRTYEVWRNIMTQ